MKVITNIQCPICKKCNLIAESKQIVNPKKWEHEDDVYCPDVNCSFKRRTMCRFDITEENIK